MSRDAFPSRELSLSGSSRCSSQPPSTRRVGSGKHLVLALGRVGGHQLLEGDQVLAFKMRMERDAAPCPPAPAPRPSSPAR
eukprot:scaffold32566_cov60-Phaeocystis_antarctica.AAC.4